MRASRAPDHAIGTAGPRDLFLDTQAANGKVPALFWPLAVAGLIGGIAVANGWLPAGSGWLLYPAIGVMQLGGLPHGACDVSLAAAAMHCDRRQLAPLIGLYILVASVMAALWWLSPILALLVFLGLSGIHFGEDWAMLPSGLLRAMAGMAVITTAAFGQQAQVAALFVALTGSPDAIMVARWAEAAAPLTWLVTLVGLLQHGASDAARGSSPLAPACWGCCSCPRSSASRCSLSASTPRCTGSRFSATCHTCARSPPDTKACG